MYHIVTIFTTSMYHIVTIFTTSVHNFRAIGQLFVEILHFKELEYTESVVTNAVWVFIYSLTNVYPCIKFESNRTIGYGDIAAKRFWGYRKCRHECSCSSARRVSTFSMATYLMRRYLPSYKVLL